MSGYPFFHPFRGLSDKNYAFKVWFYTLISCRKVNGYASEYVLMLMVRKEHSQMLSFVVTNLLNLYYIIFSQCRCVIMK